MMGTRKWGFLFWLLFLLFPSLSTAQLFQWTDARGVIHFTDNLHSVPQPVRDSPQLIVRDFPNGISFSEIPVPPSEPKLPEFVSLPEPERPKVSPPVIHYSPQETTIVVVNTILPRPKGKICPVPGGCRPAVKPWKPDFNDRRFIHPSVFDGGPRQYIHPGSFQPARK